MKSLFVPTLLLLAAPAAFAAAPCITSGRDWRELKSAHLIIDTDAIDADAGRLVRDLERAHALLLQALVGEQVDIPGHLRVIALADQTEFAALAGAATVAGFYRRGRLGEPTVVVPVRGTQDPETLAHELAHYLSFYLYPVQPAWFAEGLAHWVQTVVALPRESGGVTGSHVARTAGRDGASAGLVPASLVSWFAYDVRLMPARELLAWNGAESEASPGRGHLSSWLLFHWLWNQRSKPFTAFQKELAETGDSAAAWKAAFPEFDPASAPAMARLDDELQKYLRSGRFSFFKVKAEGNASYDAAPLSPSSLHLLLASQLSAAPEARAAFFRACTAQAAAEDPESPAALASQALLLGKPDPAALRKALQARPDDWQGWLLLARTEMTGVTPAEREAALRKAVQLNPESAFAANELAWLLANSGNAKEALPLANRALDLEPWNAQMVDTLAEVAARLGKCTEAKALERRTVLSDPTESMKKRAAELEQRCK